MPTPKGGAENKSVTQDTDDTEKNGKTPPVNPREALIEGFAEKVSARHREEQSEAEAKGLGAPPDDSAAEEGTQSAVADPPGKDAPGTVEDPLAGFVFMQEGKPMVRLKVDGAERLISADEARTMLQKNVAADVRLQEAARLRKDLDARAVQIQAQAADLAQREAKLKTTQPPRTDAGDPDLDADSKSLAKVLLTGTEDEVAATVKTVLAKSRQATAPVIDKNQIVTEVVQTVTASQQAAAVQAQVRADITKFDTDFADIVADKKLYAIADVISDEVKGEHPEWTTSQILTEAGNRTRDYAKGLQKPANPLPANRQERKEQLRPMPQSRAGVPAPKEVEQRTTPAQTLAEIRKSRGQA
jgi:hypothetical protein